MVKNMENINQYLRNILNLDLIMDVWIIFCNKTRKILLLP